MCLSVHVCDDIYVSQSASQSVSQSHSFQSIIIIYLHLNPFQISSALGVNSVSFGYEKSADYGNGIEINGVEVPE